MSRLISQTLVLALTSAFGLAGLAGPTFAANKTVLELFTSQGCSSCPPADALFERYVARDDVIALSFHVDYWDRLGWKDTLGDPAFTDRQRQYARSRGDSDVYTPQMVINGRVHANGSSETAIEAEISHTERPGGRQNVPVHLTFQNGQLSVDAGAAGVGADLVVAFVQRSSVVAINRGENAGRNVEYRNVVRVLKPIGTWQGKTMRIDMSDVPRRDISMAVVLLQKAPGEPILGAEAINIQHEGF